MGDRCQEINPSLLNEFKTLQYFLQVDIPTVINQRHHAPAMVGMSIHLKPYTLSSTFAPVNSSSSALMMIMNKQATDTTLRKMSHLNALER